MPRHPRRPRVNLSPKEYRLLEVFMQSPKRVWSRDKLLERVWGIDFMGDSKTVDVHIRWLREKLETNPSAHLHPHRARVRLPLRMIEALRRWLGRPRQPVIRSRQLLDWLEEASQGFLVLDRANRLQHLNGRALGCWGSALSKW